MELLFDVDATSLGVHNKEILLLYVTERSYVEGVYGVVETMLYFVYGI